VKSIQARQALHNYHQGQPHSMWCNNGQPVTEPPSDGQGGARVYEPFLQLHWEPKFQLSREGSYFAAGSCFARNVEKALGDAGARVVSWTPESPVANEALHRYNTFSILRDFRLALDGQFDDDALVEAAPGRWFDYSAYGRADTRDDLARQRRQCIDLHAAVLEADVLVITLGLVEAWYDRKLGSYLNVFPSGAVQADPDRYELRITGYAENLAALESFWDYLRKATARPIRMIVSVSPIPFNATFSGQDVVEANTYSKSVLRAVAQDFADANEDVMYFPSYEMVTLSDPDAVWTPDMRHVRSDFVRRIMEFFMERCVR
jgi:hypothetical protein